MSYSGSSTSSPSTLAQDGVMSPSNNAAHAKLIAELQGQTMHVPNMLAKFTHWPCFGRNKYYKRLKDELDEVVVRSFPDEKQRKRAEKSDFALFTCIWYPEADWEKLYACGLFSFWIFHCDDLMDENEDSVSLDFNASCRYREQVLAYTRYWLGLDPPGSKKSIFTKALSSILPSPKGEGHWAASLLGFLGAGPGREPPCPNGACSSFKDFGIEVQKSHTKVFREKLAEELREYLEHCEIEQKERLTGETSKDYESYVALRSYTSAVRIYCYITQIAYGIQVPEWLLDSPDMEALWKQININIIIGNDILSAKKELAGGCIHNAIPIIYHQGKPLEAVIPELMKKLEDCRDRFDEIAQTIQKKADGASPKVRADVAKYIDGLRTIATGTMEFCKIADRYGLRPYFNEDGTMDVVL